ncbi:MAG TPA: [protein-PII] uridylyltransferase [Acidimicrobiales bacterium]|nr:[protein-PII] uridylyltransferase [Acidimicrobiales bacterium]
MVDRAALLADRTATGTAWCAAHSALVDDWIAGLLADAAGLDAEGVALVAVGGYGRSELCPQSDIDLMLVHAGRRDVGQVAERVWYPIWDRGLHLGHSVCTVKEALALAADDLDTATALLSTRPVAGDGDLAGRLAVAARAQWEKQWRRMLTELGARVDTRHEAAGEVAFRLEPDLKEGRGGLRDVHSLRWAEQAHRVILEHDDATLSAAYDVLLDARVELQRLTGRPGNVLALQEQAAVARALGRSGDDELMAAVAEAARTIAWTSDDTWRRIRSALQGPLGRLNRRTKDLGGGVVVRDGDVHLAADADAGDPCVLLRAAAAAAAHDGVIDRPSLERLAAGAGDPPVPWPASMRALFVELLAAGPRAVDVVESLDQRGAWARVLPEWQAVRARPQRNAYHRFTVDRHLLEAVANASVLAGRVDRPDLLLVGALLHDIGKGQPGDHTEAGVRMVRVIASRMGFPPEDVDTLAFLVAQHLLLPEVAGRRDLDDATTIERVATAVGSTARLALLAALTEADARATGPAAWGPTTAALVAQLVERVAHVLAGGDVEVVTVPQFPSPAHLARLAEPGRHVEAKGGVVTVVSDDRPGTFSRVAGVLALHGLTVVSASAWSSDGGRALSEFRVVDPVRRETPWAKVAADVERGLDGRLAIPARLAERARSYARKRPAPPAVAVAVTFDDDASADLTVVDVHAPDRPGVLYRITRALAEMDIDIRSARVQTLGHQAVDAFYVRDRNGQPLTDPLLRAEIERALLHGLSD